MTSPEITCNATTRLATDPKPDRHIAGDTDPDFPQNLHLAETADLPLLETPRTVVSENHLATTSADVDRLPSLSETQVPESINGTQPSLNLPAYIATFESRVEQADVDMLKERGVFDMLPTDIGSLALDGFFGFIYPLFPVVDYLNVLEAIASKGESGTISLLVYYGMILAGVPFIDPGKLTDAGFESPQTLSRVVYRRMKASALTALSHIKANANAASV